ncbi:Tip elongation aberrant protein Tea4 [Colletotrichum chlorophyti]|uniref:Tip elongation aberrant protein Tea4 n=1 Tax=Colletotrichum chlorophyti TaxID=708187 RepID=A0A1Q8REN2_9PEZI|nr:Tip elongation aberrant protein Tea4 [Colletotrichum chlorophyti]
MTRPHIVRADTIDLQDHDAPSAKDHSRGTTNGSFGPHQAETLREVAQESAEDQARSPRLSWTNADDDDISDSDDLAGEASRKPNGGAMDDAGKKQQQDALAAAQNGGASINSDDGDMDDTDESLDDDMMDKISSSPSIEDGGYPSITPPPSWPRRVDSLPVMRNRASSVSPAFSEARSSSPYPELDRHTNDDDDDDDDELCDERYDERHEKQRSQQQYYSGQGGDGLYNELYDDYDWYTRNINQHDAKFGLEGVAQHGPIVICPLRLPGSAESGPDAFTLRRAEMERAERDEALSRYDDDDIPLTVAYEPSIEDDDDDVSFPDDPRYIVSGWGNECLHEAEDIDFEFVYALHTFVATVEGQANATKGDTMVLLDDSNSYWWLVRVVKDSSIGYLPAEHIETPTERLARLNKHRNIDVVAPSMEEMNLSDLDQLSATMLGDQAGEKSKSTFKTALRKKKKTVAFAAPTYVDYSDFDYSSDEEDMDELLSQQQGAQQQQQQQQSATQQSKDESLDDETAKVEPLKPRTTKEVKVAEPTRREDASTEDSKRDSGEIFEKPEGPSRSRNGTVRNTDSFFKDETVETKKITLTPNLLRDDNGSRPSTTESAQVKQRPSLDKIEKELQPDKKEDKKKKDKKEKEKKPSAIRSFFSRKDKKKVADDDDESFGKRSMDTVSVTESQDREEEDQREPLSPRMDSQGQSQRNTSKLQKQQPRVEPSPARKPGPTAPQKSPSRELSEFISTEGRPNNVSNVPPASMRIVEDDSSDPDLATQQQRIKSPETARSTAQPKEEKSTLSNIIPSKTGNSDKPQKVTKAKSRVELDDFDSSGEEVDLAGPSTQQAVEDIAKEEKQERPLPGAFPDSYLSTQSGAGAQTDKTVTPSQIQPQHSPVERGKERLSESPVQVSPVTATNPPALMVDTSSQEGHSTSPSPELIDAEEAGRHRAQDSMTASSTSTGGSTTGSSWNDAKLRAFFDSSSDIRDMLVVVYDKSDVAPAGPDHPVAGSLFREQNAKLAEITTQLDNMLGDWLARKQRLRGTV